MPIQFRCNHCQQLLGISRRRAGAWVVCPTCAGTVRVPELPEQTGQAVAPPDPALLERSDFEVFLQPLALSPPRSGERTRAGALPANRRDPDSARRRKVHNPPWDATAPDQPPPPGLFLTPGRAALAAVLVLVLLILAFVAGLLVGRYTRPALNTPESSAARVAAAHGGQGGLPLLPAPVGSFA
jgi:hypothetical protein